MRLCYHPVILLNTFSNTTFLYSKVKGLSFKLFNTYFFVLSDKKSTKRKIKRFIIAKNDKEFLSFMMSYPIFLLLMIHVGQIKSYKNSELLQEKEGARSQSEHFSNAF